MLNEHHASPAGATRSPARSDCLGLLDGVPVLLDFKTRAPKDVAANLQTAAYQALALEWAKEDDQLAGVFQTAPARQTTRRALEEGRHVHRSRVTPTPTDFRQFRTLVEAQQIVASYKGSWIDLADVA